MPETRNDLIAKIKESPRLTNIQNTLRLKTTDLTNKNFFAGQAFLAGTYLDQLTLDQTNVPRGQINPASFDYSNRLKAVRQMAVKYHDGPYCDTSDPSPFGFLAGERVVAIFELFKGSKTVENLTPDLINFLGRNPDLPSQSQFKLNPYLSNTFSILS